MACRHVPAEAARVGQILGEMGAVDEQLLGDAAADDAGAADFMLLGDRNLRAMGRGDARGADAARAGADHEQIIVEAGHYSSSPRAFAISALVEASKSRSSPASIALAIALPSSTPNWSNGLMPSKAAFAKVRCS